MAYDAYYASVSLLLHFDGADGSTTITDSSPSPKTVTALGDAQIRTARKRFGTSSLLLDGTGDYVRVLAGSPTGTGDFCLEMFVYPVALPAAGTVKMVAQWLNTTGVNLELRDDGKVGLYLHGVALYQSGGALAAGQWSHIALVRDATLFRVFINGVQAFTLASTTSFAAATLEVGYDSTAPTRAWLGSMDELRLTLGVKRYSSAFTPLTEAFPARDHEDVLISPAGSVSGFSGATAALLCPAPHATGGVLRTAFIELTAPAPTVLSFGGASSTLTAPRTTLQATAHDSTGERSAGLTCPRPTLNAYCGANATLGSPAPTLSTTATVTNFGAAALRAPAGFISAAGTVSGTATASLNAPMATLVGYSGAVCSLTLSGSPTVSASGTTGGVGSANIRGPSPRLISGGMAQGYGSANLLAPAGHLGATARAWLTAPSPMLTATGHAVVAATYEAYAINLNHTPKPGVEPVDETTRYSRFPFTHIVRHKNSYYGVAADGLYLLEGATDDGVPTPYAVKTATTDFKSPYQKTVASAYLGGRLGPGATVTLHAGEGAQSQAYPYTTPRGALAQNYRQVFGKGIRHHRYYALGLSGTDVLELDNIELDTHQMTRRI